MADRNSILSLLQESMDSHVPIEWEFLNATGGSGLFEVDEKTYKITIEKFEETRIPSGISVVGLKFSIRDDENALPS